MVSKSTPQATESKLSRINLSFEYDRTLRDVKYNVRQRTDSTQ